jgi:rod shape determining protein RodA
MFDKRLISHFDWTLLGLSLALVGIGVLGVYSATYKGASLPSPWAIRQLTWVGLGVVGLSVAFAVDYRRLQQWAPLLYALTIMLRG